MKARPSRTYRLRAVLGAMSWSGPKGRYFAEDLICGHIVRHKGRYRPAANRRCYVCGDS